MGKRRYFRMASGMILGVAGVVATLGSLIPVHAASNPTVVDLMTDTDAVRIVGEELGDKLGEKACGCDINGDGIDDLIVGAREADGPQNGRLRGGEVYVVYGRRGKWAGPLDFATSTDVHLFGQDPFDNLGSGVACGDINGDGFGDIIATGQYADSLANSRNAAGQGHVILGGPDLPPEIDLLSDPGIVIYGAVEDDQFGRFPTVGDINGDGILDLLLDADNARNADGFRGAGRVHILFGRAQWPSSVDLLTDSDVTIRGVSYEDFFGRHLAAGDLDGDSTDEVIVHARGGDGPLDIRENAGEVHVFLGRAVWPAEIDLAVENPDMLVFGADKADRAGSPVVADLDVDGSAELLVGTPSADGRSNADSLTGEIRGFEPGAPLPAIVDLGTDTESIIYGDESGDFFNSAGTGDFNGDGTEDLACGSGQGDGPNNERWDTGEGCVVYGPRVFPEDADISEVVDVLIYGLYERDFASVRAAVDINGDGIDEIVFHTGNGADTNLPTVWLISPVDVDGDGITQLPDNCPLVYNPDQSDGDGDLVGDACQGDYDGDGQADGDDCAPSDANAGTPPEVQNLGFESESKTLLSWDGAVFSDEYDVSRGRLSALDGSDYGSCQNSRDPDLSDTFFDDDEVPPAGGGFFYLVRGRSRVCGLGGTYGRRSDGVERVNINPERCP